MIRKVVSRIVPVFAFALLAFVVSTQHAHAATCVPGTGMATLTDSSVPVNNAGSNNVWVRLQSANALAIKVGVEVTPSGGVPTCLIASNPTPTSSTTWSWVKVGTATVTATNNTVKLVGMDAGVRVDRVIFTLATDPCVPSNTRNTAVSPIVEPGDNCIVASPAPTTTTPSTPPPTADTAKPVGPSGLTATAASTTQVNLSWPAATDNVGVTAYTLTRNGTQIYTGANLSYNDTGLTAGTTYTYAVTAKDAAGNVSSGATASATTTSASTPPPPPPTDAIAPTAPGNLSRTLQYDYTRFSYFMDLNWTASTDNVGVKDYTVKRNSTQIGTSTTTNFRDYNVAAGTWYTYEISGRDAAGNVSLPAKTTTIAQCFLVWCWLQ